MSIPSRENVIINLQRHLDVTLHKVPGKQLFYRGILKNGKELLVCTPGSKLYPRGHWWVDITTIQSTMLDEAEYAILAFRMEGNKVYYLNFSVLKRLLTKEAMKYNEKEGYHWKMHVWPNYLQVLGNDFHLPIQSDKIDPM